MFYFNVFNPRGRYWSLFSHRLSVSPSVRPLVRPKTSKSSDNHCRPGQWAGRVDHWWLLCLVQFKFKDPYSTSNFVIWLSTFIIKYRYFPSLDLYSYCTCKLAWVCLIINYEQVVKNCHYFHSKAVGERQKVWENWSSRPTHTRPILIAIFTRVVRPSVSTFQNQAKQNRIFTAGRMWIVGWPRRSMTTHCLVINEAIFQGHETKQCTLRFYDTV